MFHNKSLLALLTCACSLLVVADLVCMGLLLVLHHVLHTGKALSTQQTLDARVPLYTHIHTHTHTHTPK